MNYLHLWVTQLAQFELFEKLVRANKSQIELQTILLPFLNTNQRNFFPTKIFGWSLAKLKLSTLLNFYLSNSLIIYDKNTKEGLDIPMHTPPCVWYIK